MKQLVPTLSALSRCSRRAFVGLGLALLASATIPSVQAHGGDDDDDNDRRGHHQRSAQVFPPHSRPYGLSYGQWQARWWQWSISIPAATHPYNSADFAAVNQSGPVWFLVGTGDPTPRAITVPRGKSIFFPLANTECSNVEPPPFFGADEAAMRHCNRQFVRTDLECFVDGLPVRNLDRFEGESPLFNFDAPDGNILIGSPAVSGQAVSSGAYVMVPPLSVGHHVIQFKATQTDPVLGTFTLYGIYNITVPNGRR